jgi:acetate kinase
MEILTVNLGSTSVKCQAYKLPQEEEFLSREYQINRSTHVITCADEKITFDPNESPYQKVFSHLRHAIGEHPWKAVVHRFVHGGVDPVNPTLITPEFIQSVQKWKAVLPLHVPFNIEGYEMCAKIFPEVPQYAAFDNGCYNHFDPQVYEYAIPADYQEKYLVRKYGYHGLSHEYAVNCVSETTKIPLGKLRCVVCHLGGGSSMSAYANGRFVDTTMGLTALTGLPMTTRCGNIDSALVFHLLRNSKMTVDEIETVLYKQSGMKGMTGTSGDMREIEAGLDTNKRCRIAFDTFSYAVKKTLGAFHAITGGLDALVWTAGIGENSPILRNDVCNSLSHLGFKLDPEKNKNGKTKSIMEISAADSKIKIFTIACKEGLHMARMVYKVAK